MRDDRAESSVGEHHGIDERFICEECGGEVALVNDMPGNTVDSEWFRCLDCGEKANRDVILAGPSGGEHLDGVVRRE